MKKSIYALAIAAVTVLGTVHHTDAAATRPLPELEGKIIFHSYDNYDDWESELRIADLDTGMVTVLGDGLTVDNEMNAHFSPDGTMITFMADDNTDDVRDWDVFTYDLETEELTNITADTFGESREEDPKFSPDGTKIVIKSSKWVRTGMVTDLYEIGLKGTIIKRLTDDEIEESMPYYSTDGRYVYYAASTGGTSDIYRINVSTLEKEAVSAIAEVEEYYPIAVGPEQVVFTRWVSSSNLNDQLYMKSGDEEPEALITNLPDENNSDFCRIDERYFCFSGTGRNGVGAYDIFIGDLETGTVYSLDEFVPDANTGLEDLGCTYTLN